MLSFVSIIDFNLFAIVHSQQFSAVPFLAKLSCIGSLLSCRNHFGKVTLVIKLPRDIALSLQLTHSRVVIPTQSIKFTFAITVD